MGSKISSTRNIAHLALDILDRNGDTHTLLTYHAYGWHN